MVVSVRWPSNSHEPRWRTCPAATVPAVRDSARTALSAAQRRVMTAIEQCRTATLGRHAEQCDHCGHRRVWYNSCANRPPLPDVSSPARATWIAKRQTELLDGPYFHVVFTVPEPIAQIALRSQVAIARDWSGSAAYADVRITGIALNRFAVGGDSLVKPHFPAPQ
jgi:hypothetical protein